MTGPGIPVVRGLVLSAALGLAGPVWAQEEGSLGRLLRSTHVHGLALEGQRLLLATHHGLHAFDAETGDVRPVGESRQDFMGFVVGADGRLYASGHPETGGNSGVLRSTDGGEHWTVLSDGLDGPVDFHQMTVSPADPQTILGAFDGRIQRSRDGGVSWEVAGSAPAGLMDLAASAGDPERVYAATATGLLVSPDGGATWEPAGFSGEPVSLIEVGPGENLHAFVLGRGLMRAEGDGLEWALLSAPLGEDHVLHFTTDGTRAYAVTASGALLVSGDGGGTWAFAGR